MKVCVHVDSRFPKLAPSLYTTRNHYSNRYREEKLPQIEESFLCSNSNYAARRRSCQPSIHTDLGIPHQERTNLINHFTGNAILSVLVRMDEILHYPHKQPLTILHRLMMTTQCNTIATCGEALSFEAMPARRCATTAHRGYFNIELSSGLSAHGRNPPASMTL